MRINDFHNILELIKQDVLHSEAEYLKLLKVVGNNQRYDFMRTEKPKLMVAWKIEDENNPQYGAMISVLKEVIIKEIVEI